jgi:hypothetical protein
MLNYSEKDMRNTFFNVGYLRNQFIISQIYSKFLIITIIISERKRVENDKSRSRQANSIILNLRYLVFYGRYVLQSVNVHVRMWEKDAV